MTIALTASGANATNADGASINVGDTSGGNFAAVGVASYFVIPITAVTDNKGNTPYSALTLYNDGTQNIQLFFFENLATGANHTFTAARTSAFPAIVAAVFSGVKTASAFDLENGTALGSSALPQQPGAITPSENNELVIAALSFYNASATISVDSPFTMIGQVDFASGVNFGVGMAYVIQTTAALSNPTFSGTSNPLAVSCQASFKATAGAATVYHNGLLLGVGG